MRPALRRFFPLSLLALASAGFAVPLVPDPCDDAVVGQPSAARQAPAAAPIVKPPPPPPRAERVGVVEGFSTPETALYDARRDVFWVSSSGTGAGGWISRLAADGTVEAPRFVEGGRGRAVLRAPRGMLLAGDTLWVADVDALRAFHAETGAPLRTVQVRGALMLDDLARGGDGALYVTDPGLQPSAGGRAASPGPRRVWRVGTDGAVSVALEGMTLGKPSGIAWDPCGKRFLIASLSSGRVLEWRPGGAAPDVAAAGSAGHDGVEVFPDGSILVSSPGEGSLVLMKDRRATPLVEGVRKPGNFGVDLTRGVVAIPLPDEGRVELWRLPPGAARPMGREELVVREALQHYLLGHATGDPAHLRAVFHPDAQMFWTRGGRVERLAGADFAGDAPGRPAADEARRSRWVESVQVDGNAAMATVVLDYPQGYVVDFLTLLKVDGEWKIVNRTFNATPRAPSGRASGVQLGAR